VLYAQSATTPRDTTIQGIQFVAQSKLDSTVCNDASTLASANGTKWPANQVWRVRGVVTIPGTANVSSNLANPTRQVWMRQIGGGAFSTISFRYNGNSTPDDMYNLRPGDTVEVTGTLSEFLSSTIPNSSTGGETQMNPIASNGVRVVASYEPGSPKPQATLVNAGLLNNPSGRNQLGTGEQYEGDYVELRNMRVVAVSRYFASNANRIQFTLQDNAGNRVVVRDRFFALRLPNCSSINPALCGNFIPPSVGDVYNKIRGIVLHGKQPCTGVQGLNNGYEVHPFDSSDMEKGKSAPYVVNLFNSPFKPTSSESVTITAEITAGTDSVGRPAELNQVKLFWDTARFDGSRRLPFRDSVVMVRSGSTNMFTATIPAYRNGAVVKYYVSANNNQLLNVNFPDVNISFSGTASSFVSPKGYTVGDSPIKIKDLQFNPLTVSSVAGLTNMITPAAGSTVTVSGYVTADTTLNGFIFMQDTMSTDYNAIMVKSDNLTLLRTLRNGQYITVTGRVDEDRQITYIQASNIVVSTSVPNMVIAPLAIPATTLVFSATTSWNYSREQYESKLVRIFNNTRPNANLYVVQDTFRVSTANIASNFGEWLISGDTLNPATGTIIVTGLAPGSSSSSTLSSNYAPYINYDDTAATRFVRVPTIKISDRRGTRNAFRSITGIIGHSFSNLKVIPRTASDFEMVPTSVIEDLANNGVSIFPNPSKDYVNVSFTDNSIAHEVVITDMNGRLVSRNQSEGTMQISTASLSSGIYMVSVAQADGKVALRKKLVVLK